MEAHGVDPRGTAPPYLRQTEKIMSMSELFTHPVWFKSKRGKKRPWRKHPGHMDCGSSVALLSFTHKLIYQSVLAKCP